MSNAPKISIITPVLNGADHIRYLVASLKNQQMTDWEHIVIDGGSTDNTLQVLRELYHGDSRLIAIEAPSLGLYASVVKGLKSARGELVGWQNADDMYTPWAFRAVDDFHQRTKACWITGLPGCWDEAGTLRFVRPYGWYPKWFIKSGWFHADLLGFIQQESIFIARDALASLSDRELDEVSSAQLAGDFMLWRRLAKAHSLSVAPTVISSFRRHSNNLSRAKFSDYMSEVRADGAWFLPSVLAVASRNLFRIISASLLLRRVETADRSLNQEIDA